MDRTLTTCYALSTHTLAEGQAVMNHLQGIEVRARKIHLDFYRTPKRSGDGKKRGDRGKRDNERQISYDGSRGYYNEYSAHSGSRSATSEV
ncbi:hypothetical protein F5Y06DRAFT_306253 [Hypoxylon sp. FL0890]|nr:hypothetical protein F5Y06DRAFT_306253 [Hypoxylon sp. FL0890]